MPSQDSTGSRIIKYQYSVCSNEAITWKSTAAIYKAVNLGDSSPANQVTLDTLMADYYTVAPTPSNDLCKEVTLSAYSD
jgi:hypothetical protein